MTSQTLNADDDPQIQAILLEIAGLKDLGVTMPNNIEGYITQNSTQILEFCTSMRTSEVVDLVIQLASIK